MILCRFNIFLCSLLGVIDFFQVCVQSSRHLLCSLFLSAGELTLVLWDLTSPWLLQGYHSSLSFSMLHQWPSAAAPVLNFPAFGNLHVVHRDFSANLRPCRNRRRFKSSFRLAMLAMIYKGNKFTRLQARRKHGITVISFKGKINKNTWELFLSICRRERVVGRTKSQIRGSHLGF